MDFKKSNFVYFDKAAKLCKAFEYAFNEWVAKGVASDVKDFTLCNQSVKPYSNKHVFSSLKDYFENTGTKYA